MNATAENLAFDHTATYDPADDKIRIYPAYRLPTDEYQQLKSAGFAWAPKQECFYAVWTPTREAVAYEFAGDIDDEDTSLVDRAEQRAERFETYSDHRERDAERAHAGVKAIADMIPFGQPILVGHHSERRARKDAQRIENGMRLAVKMWDTAEYWTRRAAGAIAHAKYKERADVRARRIKGLQADLRKQQANKSDAESMYNLWSLEGLTLEKALMYANTSKNYISRCFPLADYPRNPPASQYEGQMGIWSALDGGVIDHETAADICTQSALRTIDHANKWIAHINNRLQYECAMLAENGGLAADKFDFQVGGKVQHRWGWSIIKKLNKKDGVLLSLSLVATSYPTKVNVEDVKDYQPPTEEETAATKAATAKAPICNYRGEIAMLNRYHGTTDAPRQTIEITQQEWNDAHADYKGTRDVPATETTARHRVRIICRGGSYPPVFITDAKEKLPPAPEKAAAKPELPEVPRELSRHREYVAPEPTKADALREQLKTGVQVVTAPQLFPTPAPLAARMVEMAEIEPGHHVLEPSSGTGRILEALPCVRPHGSVTAIEINYNLSKLAGPHADDVICADFLQWSSPKYFDRVLMNPPFADASDIKHIKHAFGMLKPGGKLVAICANGPRQAEQLKPLADTWEPLPAGTFEGTGVNTVLLTMSK